MTKKLLATLFLSIIIVSFLGGQSLAELSKKEKERRASLKDKGTVVTNDALGKVKKKPAVSTGQAAKTDEEVQVGNPEVAAETATPPEGEDARAQQAPPDAEQTPSEQVPPADQESALTDQQFNAMKTELEDQRNRAQELVDYLTMRMNALWQQFYNMDSMGTRDKVQLEISETYYELLKAQESQVRAEEELNSFVSRPRPKEILLLQL
jgi:hypothetical protein